MHISLSNSSRSFRADPDEREHIHTFGFAFPDSQRGEKTKPHVGELRTRFLNARMHRGNVMLDESAQSAEEPSLSRRERNIL